jgi:beta-galactosidase
MRLPPPGGDAVVSAHPADGVLNQGNRTLDFDHGWKFKLVNTADTTDPSGVYGDSSNPLASVVGFDDSAWAPVTLPHDWSIGQLPDPANSNATGYFPGGLGWYRKAFTLPATMAGKRLSVEFDGVYMNSYVYLNGTLLGNHPYGYTGFNIDITSLVHADGATPNVLAVVVQNKEPSSRWYSGSGITRNVHLTVTDPIHVSRDGIFVTTPDLATTITTHYADVHIQTQAQDDNGTSADAQIVSTIKNSTGQVVATNISSKLTVSATPSMAQADITVKNPHLWSTTDPYLYTLETDVVVGHRTVDTYDTTFGIRWFVFDPNGGVMVNGSHIKIQGVDLHNDQGALGSVNNYDALWRQMSILKSQGVNAFRTSQEETFGPVAIVDIVEDAEDAIRRANESVYGLTAGVITGDSERGMAIGERLDAGIIHINDQPIHDEPQMPFGGVKDSGWGRFGVTFAPEEFTDTHWITVKRRQRSFPF